MRAAAWNEGVVQGSREKLLSREGRTLDCSSASDHSHALALLPTMMSLQARLLGQQSDGRPFTLQTGRSQ